MNELFDLHVKIKSVKDFGKLSKITKKQDGSFQLPSYTYHDVVRQFKDTIYKNYHLPKFDWMRWNEGISLLENQNFVGLNEKTLLMLLVLIVRADRYCDGFLIGKFEDGCVLAILRELSKDTGVTA